MNETKLKLRIRELREKHPEKPSQHTMALKLGVVESTYKRMESNQVKSIPIRHLEKLVDIFDCEVSDLFERSKND